MRRRPQESKARSVIETVLSENVPGYPEYGLCEDGASGWAFWISPSDTTSYLRADLSVEWYGTGWPEFRKLDDSTGEWVELNRECQDE